MCASPRRRKDSISPCLASPKWQRGVWVWKTTPLISIWGMQGANGDLGGGARLRAARKGPGRCEVGILFPMSSTWWIVNDEASPLSFRSRIVPVSSLGGSCRPSVQRVNIHTLSSMVFGRSLSNKEGLSAFEICNFPRRVICCTLQTVMSCYSSCCQVFLVPPMAL